MLRKATMSCILVWLALSALGFLLFQPATLIYAAGHTWIVTSALDSGNGTLRWCLMNASGGGTIAFDSSVFPSTSPVTIALTSELPHIIQGNLTIDASSAGVILNGSQLPADSVGLFIDSENISITKLQILHFPSWGIRLTTNAVACSISYNTIANNGGGIMVSQSQDNNISGNNVRENDSTGIYLYKSSNNTIYGNNVTANNQIPIHNVQEAGHGIRLVNSIRNSIFGNRIRNNWYGIRLANSANNDISGNYVANNDEGIQLYESSNNNSISGNTFINDGLTVYGSYENVVDDNWVNGKSLVYLEDVSDRIIEDAGQVILVNCSHITVRNSRLSNTTTGVQLLQTKNTEISGNNITANSDVGILLYESSNNNIFGNYIANNDEGIQLYESSNNNSISGNNITANIWDGIQLHESSNNNIFSNNITASNQSSIRLYQSSSNNSIFRNYIANNDEAIQIFWPSVDNAIYHNNFIENVLSTTTYGDFWDVGYPSGGNYWSNYEGADLYSGEGQNETGRDGIGDTRYGQDNYPLMGMFSEFNATSEHHVQTICNSSISDFQYNGTALSFNVTGEDYTEGFCRICTPTTLMNEAFRVFVNGTEILPPPEPLTCSNSTHIFIYFTYSHSKQEVIIIPEFPSLLILPLFMTTTLLAATVYKRKRKDKQA